MSVSVWCVWVSLGSAGPAFFPFVLWPSFPLLLAAKRLEIFCHFRVSPRGRPERGWWRLTGVLRGGSWIKNDPENLRAANRNNNHPANRNNNVGFRVVCVGESRKAGRAAIGVMPPIASAEQMA